MPKSKLIRSRLAVWATCTLLLVGCDGGKIVDNWPTYEVHGTVRTSAGVPVGSVVDSVQVVEGETAFAVDLTIP